MQKPLARQQKKEEKAGGEQPPVFEGLGVAGEMCMGLMEIEQDPNQTQP